VILSHDERVSSAVMTVAEFHSMRCELEESA